MLTYIYIIVNKEAVAMVHPLFPLGPSSDLAVRRGLSTIMGRELGSSEVAEVLSELGDCAGS